MSNKHVNNGDCEKCDDLFETYPGFLESLRAWFKTFQKKHPDAHISCAGRGKDDQEEAFTKRTSLAHWGQSAHNFGGALDIFRLTQSQGASYDRTWFRDAVGTAVFSNNANPERRVELTWYGAPGSKYFELPHVQATNWEELVREGVLNPVEPLLKKGS